MASLGSKKHYIGNVSVDKFYYKDDVFSHYNMGFITLPYEIKKQIVSYICPSLVVFATNYNIHFVNPNDNQIIKSIQLEGICELDSTEEKFAISEDGMTFYVVSNKDSHYYSMKINYLCHETADTNEPSNINHREFVRTRSHRYYYIYNIDETCTISTKVHDFDYMSNYDPDYSQFSGIKYYLSNNGKYIVAYVNKEQVINNSGAYIAIYETKTKTLINEIKFDVNKILGVSISPNNNNLWLIMAITSDDNKNTIWIWDINTSKQLYHYNCSPNMVYDKTFNEIAWSHNSNNFAITFGIKEMNEINDEPKFIASGILYGTFNNTFIVEVPGIDIFGINIYGKPNDEYIACHNSHKIFICKWNTMIGEPLIDYDKQNINICKLASSLDNYLIVISEDTTNSLINQLLRKMNEYELNDDNNDQSDNHSDNQSNWPETSNNQSDNKSNLPETSNNQSDNLNNDLPETSNDNSDWPETSNDNNTDNQFDWPETSNNQSDWPETSNDNSDWPETSNDNSDWPETSNNYHNHDDYDDYYQNDDDYNNVENAYDVKIIVIKTKG